MMTVHNWTGHPRDLYADGRAFTLEPEGDAYAELATTDRQTVEACGMELPLLDREVRRVGGLPELVEGRLLMVAPLVMNALPGRRDLVICAQLVRANGRVIGAEALSRTVIAP